MREKKQSKGHEGWAKAIGFLWYLYFIFLLVLRSSKFIDTNTKKQIYFLFMLTVHTHLIYFYEKKKKKKTGNFFYQAAWEYYWQYEHCFGEKIQLMIVEQCSTTVWILKIGEEQDKNLLGATEDWKAWQKLKWKCHRQNSIRNM